MRLFEQKENCYGCGACYNLCPKSAIEMIKDNHGFVYPQINDELCVECGKCQLVCQINKEESLQEKASTVCYGIKNTDQIRYVSSSGGFYTALSDTILNLNGVCIGAAFNSNMQIVHTLAGTSEERNLFRGSKYVQSDINHIFQDVINKLNLGANVLFTGTPCQVSGLKKFLEMKNIDISNLYLNDIVCHGVPSPGVWDEYIKFLENKYNSKVVDFVFRDKEMGWRGYHSKVTFEDNVQVRETDDVQSFVRLFSRDIMMRLSCYQCPYASLKRSGDITIADFWGIEDIDATFSDNKGISMVFVNTEKGNTLFKSICASNNLKINEYDIRHVKQKNLYGPTKKGDFYQDFWNCFNRYGYKKVAEKYGGYGRYQKIYHFRDSLTYRIKKLRGKL